MWYDEHRSAIEKLKHVLMNSPVLQYFNPDKLITIQTDTSKSGIGSCLLQEGHPVIYASRSLTTAEQNYTQIEKELLAIVFACERFHQFVYRNDIVVQSDHKPLEAIMTKPLSQAPPRIQQLAEGFPMHRKVLKPILAPYWNIRNELSEADGLLFKGRQLIIPKAMRSNVLDLIHESHLGIEKCKACARAIVYWPGMSRDIHDTVAMCKTCLTHRHKNQKELMIPHTIPDHPWQKLGSDVFEHKGKPYLVVVDYYSKFETSLLRDKTAGTIVIHMKSIFARHRISEELISDNMPYNSKEFKQFAGIQADHLKSHLSPREWPQ